MRRAFGIAVGLALATWAAGLVWPSGLRGQYFAGPELSGSPVRAPIDAEFSGLQLSRRWNFAPPESFSAQWSGYIFIGRPGRYTFSLTADDSARLYVDRQLIVDRGPGPGTRSVEIPLAAGSHAVLLQYFQLGGPYQLQWQWGLDGEALSTVPAWALSTTPRGFATILAIRSFSAMSWMFLAIGAAAGVALLWRSAPRSRAPDAPGSGSDAAVGAPRVAAAFAMFLMLACLYTWPLISNPAHLSRNDNADTILNEWTMRWVVHQAVRDPFHLFDGNIFYPDRHTLAYSESLIVQSAIGAPLAWLGASPVLVYNLVLLAGFALTGCATALLVARWTGDRAGGVAAGMLAAFNAHTLTRLPHIQAQHVEFLPLALLSLDSLLRRPRWSSAIGLAVSFALQSLTSLYLLVFTAVALVVGAAVRPEEWMGARLRGLAPKIVGAAALAILVLAPFLWPYWDLHREGFGRSLDEVAFFSARAADYLTTPSRLHRALGTTASGGNALFPGVTALALSAIALVGRNRDCRVRMCVAFGLTGVVLSFGPIVPGYPSLYSAVPLFQAIRTASRFGFLMLFAVAVLGGYGLAALRRSVSSSGLKNGLTAAALALLVLESYSGPMVYQPFEGIPEIYRLPSAAQEAVVVDLPFHAPDATYRNAPSMLGSTLNFRPLLNGYSGFTPPSYFAHYEQFRTFPDEVSIRALQAAGVTHVFVHLDRFAANTEETLERFTPLHRITKEESIVLYQLETGQTR